MYKVAKNGWKNSKMPVTPTMTTFMRAGTFWDKLFEKENC